MLTLERIGVRRPALYAALTRLAEQISIWRPRVHAPRLPTSRARSRSLNGWCECEASTRSTAERLLEALALVPFKESVAFSAGLRRGCSLNFAPPSEETEGSRRSWWRPLLDRQMKPRSNL